MKNVQVLWVFVFCVVFATERERPKRKLSINKRDSWFYKSYAQIAPFSVSPEGCSNNESEEKLFVPKPVETEFELMDIQWKTGEFYGPEFHTQK